MWPTMRSNLKYYPVPFAEFRLWFTTAIQAGTFAVRLGRRIVTLAKSALQLTGIKREQRQSQSGIVAIRRSQDGAAGRAGYTGSPGTPPLRPRRSSLRRASLPGAGGRHLPLWGGAPPRHNRYYAAHKPVDRPGASGIIAERLAATTLFVT